MFTALKQGSHAHTLTKLVLTVGLAFAFAGCNV